MTTEVLRNMIYARSADAGQPGLRRDGRGALPRRPVPRRGLGGGDHRPGGVGPGGRPVGHGEQRRGVRRLAVGGPRRDGRRRLRAPAGAAVPARAWSASTLYDLFADEAPTAVGRAQGREPEVNPALLRWPGRSPATSATTPGARAAATARASGPSRYGSGAYGGGAAHVPQRQRAHRRRRPRGPARWTRPAGPTWSSSWTPQALLPGHRLHLHPGRLRRRGAPAARLRGCG